MDTFHDGGIGLLSLDANLLEDDALCVPRATSVRGLENVSEGTLFVGFIRL